MAAITDQFVTSSWAYGTAGFGDVYRAPEGTDIIFIDETGLERYFTVEEFKTEFPDVHITGLVLV